MPDDRVKMSSRQIILTIEMPILDAALLQLLYRIDGADFYMLGKLLYCQDNEQKGIVFDTNQAKQYHHFHKKRITSCWMIYISSRPEIRKIVPYIVFST